MSSIELVIKSERNLFQPFLIHIYDTFTIKDIKKCLYCIFPYTKYPENISIISAVELNEDQIISKIVADSVTEPFIFYDGAPCLLVKFDESEDVEEIKNYHLIHQDKTGSDLVNSYLKNLESNQLNYSSAFQHTYGMSSHSMQFSTKNLDNKSQSVSTAGFNDEINNHHNRKSSHTQDDVTYRHVSEPRPQQQPPAPPQPPPQPAADPDLQNDPLGVVVNEAFGLRLNINAFGMNLAVDPVNILWTIIRFMVLYFLLFSQTSLIRLLLMVIIYLTATMMWKVFCIAFQEHVVSVRNWLRHHPIPHQMSVDVNGGGDVNEVSTGIPPNNTQSNQPFVAIDVPRMGLIYCLMDHIKQIFKTISIFVAGFLISLFPHHRNL